jgi:hypothetical protein
MEDPFFLQELSNVFKLVLPVVITVALPTVVMLFRSLVKKASNKFDVQTRVAVSDMMDNIVTRGVAFAEQEAKKYGRQTKYKMDSDHKLEQAVRYVVGEIESYNLPRLAGSEIRDKVESCLGLGTLNVNLNSGGEDESTVYDE